jgi:large subunit ribosomal protein L24
MSIAKIQSGDSVKIIAGNYKGITGTVTKIIHKKYPKGKGKFLVKTRASVDTIKKIAKYRKSTVYQGQKYAGSMSQVDRFVDVSNLMLLDENMKATRVRIEVKDDKKTRIFATTSGAISKKILPKVKKNNDDQALNNENSENILELEAKSKPVSKVDSKPSKTSKNPKAEDENNNEIL